MKVIISGEPSLEVYLSLLHLRVQCVSSKPRFRLNVGYVLSLQDQASDSQKTNIGTLEGHYSAVFKNRVELIFGSEK